MHNKANYEIGDPICVTCDLAAGYYTINHIVCLPLGESAESDEYRRLLVSFGAMHINETFNQLVVTGGSLSFPTTWYLPFHNGREELLSAPLGLPQFVSSISKTQPLCIGDVFRLPGDITLWVKGSETVTGFTAYNLTTSYSKEVLDVEKPFGGYEIVVSPAWALESHFYIDPLITAKQELEVFKIDVETERERAKEEQSVLREQLRMSQDDFSLLSIHMYDTQDRVRDLQPNPLISEEIDVQIIKPEERRPSNLGDLTVTDCHIIRKKDE